MRLRRQACQVKLRAQRGVAPIAILEGKGRSNAFSLHLFRRHLYEDLAFILLPRSLAFADQTKRHRDTLISTNTRDEGGGELARTCEA